MLVPQWPNDRWSLDFVADSWVFVFDGQRLHSAPHARRLKDRAAHQIANQRF
jgi:hypothetical protein